LTGLNQGHPAALAWRGARTNDFLEERHRSTNKRFLLERQLYLNIPYYK
jgi:hypothetical protein